MTAELPTDAGTLLEWLDRRQRNNDFTGVVRLLTKMPEERRLAVAPLVDAHIRSLKGDDWWKPALPPQPAGLGLIVIGTAPSAAKAAALLTRRTMRDGWGGVPLPHLLDLVRARRPPWLGDLATRLAGDINAQTVEWSGEWTFVEAMLRESGTMPPVTEAVARGWLSELTPPRRREIPAPLVDRLRDSPYLDLLLPAFFELDGLGAATGDGDGDDTPDFPLALARLAAEGRLDRGELLSGTLDRLLRGDKPTALRTFTALHEALAPTLDELTAHAHDYAQLLPAAGSPVAGLAQRMLRTVDEAGRLKLETLLDASAGVLLRKEKVLVKAQLSWLEKVTRRVPDRRAEILETVAVAFGHPALDIQERALTLIARQVPRLHPDDVALLAGHAVALGGDLPGRAAEIFGSAPPDPGPDEAAGALPPPPPVAEMPPPIAGVAELAEELVTLVQPGKETAVGWERLLAAIVTLNAAGDRAALTDAVLPVLERYAHAFSDAGWNRLPRTVLLGVALRQLISDRGDRQGRAWQRMITAIRDAWQDASLAQRAGVTGSPADLLALRISELSVRLRREPVPFLMATPTHVTGSLDAEVLLARLSRAEAEGWTPWPFDLEQALIRVPRAAAPDVVTRASALTGEAGRRFAEMLRAGGVADPVVTRVEQVAQPGRNTWVARRVVAGLKPSAPTGLHIEGRLLHLAPAPYPVFESAEADDTWAMTMPHHRDAVAAWALPGLASLADLDLKGGSAILPLLAECDGPIGPGLSYALGYVLGARHESDRLAAVDAFLTLAARGEPFAAGVGAAIGDLCAHGTVKVSRVCPALADVYRAGAADVLWESLTVALPQLLPMAPRGLADLLELATLTARAAGARGTFAQLEAAVHRGGTSRLAREAKRLRDVLNR